MRLGGQLVEDWLAGRKPGQNRSQRRLKNTHLGAEQGGGCFPCTWPTWIWSLTPQGVTSECRARVSPEHCQGNSPLGAERGTEAEGGPGMGDYITNPQDSHLTLHLILAKRSPNSGEFSCPWFWGRNRSWTGSKATLLSLVPGRTKMAEQERRQWASFRTYWS